MKEWNKTFSLLVLFAENERKEFRLFSFHEKKKTNKATNNNRTVCFCKLNCSNYCWWNARRNLILHLTSIRCPEIEVSPSFVRLFAFSFLLKRWMNGLIIPMTFLPRKMYRTSTSKSLLIIDEHIKRTGAKSKKKQALSLIYQARNKRERLE